MKVNRLFEAQGIGLVGLEVGEEEHIERMLESDVQSHSGGQWEANSHCL